MSDLLPYPTRKATHVAVLIQLVVGEFDFFEGHHLLQQLLSSEWGVRVYVQPKKKNTGKRPAHKKNLTSCLVHGHHFHMKLKACNILLLGYAVVSQTGIS